MSLDTNPVTLPGPLEEMPITFEDAFKSYSSILELSPPLQLPLLFTCGPGPSPVGNGKISPLYLLDHQGRRGLRNQPIPCPALQGHVKSVQRKVRSFPVARNSINPEMS